MILCARGVGSGSWKHAVSFKADCKHSSIKRSPSTKIKSGSRPSRTRRACFRRSLEGLVMTISLPILHSSFVIGKGRLWQCQLSLASISAHEAEWEWEMGLRIADCGLGIGDWGFMSLFNQEREIEIDSLNSI